MKKLPHSFRTRLFAGFLVASLVPVLLCSAMLLQVFRLRLDSQADEECRGQLNRVVASLDGLYAGFRQTALALQASPYVAPALASEQSASGMVYSELYSATEGSRSAARFDLCDSRGTSLYSTGSTPLETPLSPNWGCSTPPGRPGIWPSPRWTAGRETGRCSFRGPPRSPTARARRRAIWSLP